MNIDIKPERKVVSVLTSTNEVWDLQPSLTRYVVICVDGETFALTPDDADNVAAALISVAMAARFNAKVSR